MKGIMKQQKVEEYLKERLLINDVGVVDSTFDELVEVVKMLYRQKCLDQKVLCLTNYLHILTLGDEEQITDSILTASYPTL